jgi:hypothetical protein
MVKALTHYPRFKCQNCNSTFSIHQAKELPNGEGIYVYFECENLENKLKKIKESGIEFDQ